MEETYNGWVIKYTENITGVLFTATKDDTELKSDSLRELKKKIDKHKKNDFTKTPIYFKDYITMREAEISSIAEEQCNGTIEAVWLIVYENEGRKIRRKERVTSYQNRLYVRSDANKRIFEETNKLNEIIADANSKINQLEEGLEKFDVQTLKNNSERKK